MVSNAPSAPLLLVVYNKSRRKQYRSRRLTYLIRSLIRYYLSKGQAETMYYSLPSFEKSSNDIFLRSSVTTSFKACINLRSAA